ncbi:MAG: PQQ-binding-like beta-propeller repeat protein [Alphaproteobacteria bacterium]|nr:PQQ-binding-like beta-propeller repeat protein [Alphaproteobacteria bacterium]
MIALTKRLRSIPAIAGTVALALALSGCSTIDTIGGWFSGTKKSNLKGERISVMASDESLQPAGDLKDIKVVLPPPYRNQAWPEPGGYAANAMYHLDAAGPLRQIWTADAGVGSSTDSRLTAPPIVAKGRVFVLDAEADVSAFDAGNGQRLWKQKLAPVGKTEFWNEVTFGALGRDMSIDPAKGFGGGTAYDNGRLFVTTGFGEVFALNPANGRTIWKKSLGIPIVNAPVADGGRVFVSSEDNHFVALAQSDGRKLWDHQAMSESAGILESTSAAVAGDFVIAPYTSGELYALNVQNGRSAWSDTLTASGSLTALSELDDIAGRPVVDRDMVFAISHAGVMVAINLNTGERVWSRDLSGIQTPWAAGDFIYVTTTDGRLLCLYRKDGRVKWLHQLQRWDDPDSKSGPIVWAGPVLVSNRLILVSSTGTAVSISPYSGELLGRTPIPDGTYIAPVVANSTLYLLTNGAQLVALR